MIKKGSIISKVKKGKKSAVIETQLLWTLTLTDEVQGCLASPLRHPSAPWTGSITIRRHQPGCGMQAHDQRTFGYLLRARAGRGGTISRSVLRRLTGWRQA